MAKRIVARGTRPLNKKRNPAFGQTQHKELGKQAFLLTTNSLCEWTKENEFDVAINSDKTALQTDNKDTATSDYGAHRHNKTHKHVPTPKPPRNTSTQNHT